MQVRVRRIDEILIQVSDTRRSLKFYRDGLGLSFKDTGYGDDSLEARVGGVRVVLHPDFDDSLKNLRRGAGMLLHFWVPNVDAYCQELRVRGIVIVEEPEDRPWGRHFSIIDPDGYQIQILGPRAKRASVSEMIRLLDHMREEDA